MQAERTGLAKPSGGGLLAGMNRSLCAEHLPRLCAALAAGRAGLDPQLVRLSALQGPTHIWPVRPQHGGARHGGALKKSPVLADQDRDHAGLSLLVAVWSFVLVVALRCQVACHSVRVTAVRCRSFVLLVGLNQRTIRNASSRARSCSQFCRAALLFLSLCSSPWSSAWLFGSLITNFVPCKALRADKRPHPVAHSSGGAGG